jgi:hypothetical protein
MGQTSFLTWGTVSTLLQAIFFLFCDVGNPRSSGFQGSHGRGSTLPNEGGVRRIGGVRIRVSCRAQFRRQTPIASYWKTPQQGIHWYPRRTCRGPHEGIYAATRWVPWHIPWQIQYITSGGDDPKGFTEEPARPKPLQRLFPLGFIRGQRGIGENHRRLDMETVKGDLRRGMQKLGSTSRG